MFALFACKRNTSKSEKNESEMKYKKRNENEKGSEMKDTVEEAKTAKRKKLSEWRDGTSTSEPVTHRDM
jgi:hypothetical protein